MNSRVLVNFAEDNGYRMMQLEHDDQGYHVYSFEHGECLCSDTFRSEFEARQFMTISIGLWK